MEKDDEIKGKGNSLDFGARMYDTRLSRWMSLDPLAIKYPFASPYTFVLNSPLWFVDPDGRDLRLTTTQAEPTIVFKVLNQYFGRKIFYPESNGYTGSVIVKSTITPSQIEWMNAEQKKVFTYLYNEVLSAPKEYKMNMSPGNTTSSNPVEMDSWGEGEIFVDNLSKLSELELPRLNAMYMLMHAIIEQKYKQDRPFPTTYDADHYPTLDKQGEIFGYKYTDSWLYDMHNLIDVDIRTNESKYIESFRIYEHPKNSNNFLFETYQRADKAKGDFIDVHERYNRAAEKKENYEIRKSNFYKQHPLPHRREEESK